MDALVLMKTGFLFDCARILRASQQLFCHIKMILNHNVMQSYKPVGQNVFQSECYARGLTQIQPFLGHNAKIDAYGPRITMLP